MRKIAALFFLLALAACAGPGASLGTDKPRGVTYESLVQPFPKREPLQCYAAGKKPFYVLSYGECVSKRGTLVSGPPARWLDDNWRWFQVRGWERLTRETLRIGKDLEAAGYDPDSARYTAELSRRIAAYRKAHPEVVPKSKSTTKRHGAA